jgi:hypothetical protein
MAMPFEVAASFLDYLRQQQPDLGVCWPQEVIVGRHIAGKILAIYDEGGYIASIPVAPPRPEQGEDVEFFVSIDDAAAVVVAHDAGLDSTPLLAALKALRDMDRPAIRKALAGRHGWSCHICDRPIPLSFRESAQYVPTKPEPLFPDIDHVVPTRYGGAHWWANLRLAHRSCNLSKRASDPMLRRHFNIALKEWTGPEFGTFTRAQVDEFFRNYVSKTLLFPPVELPDPAN